MSLVAELLQRWTSKSSLKIFIFCLTKVATRERRRTTVKRGDQYHENSRTMQARSCLRKLLIWLHSVLFTNQLGTLVSLAQCNFPRTKGLEFLVQLRIVSKARDETFTLCQETWFRPWPWLVSPRGCSKICSSYCGALCKYTTGNKQNKQARKSERRFQRNFLSLRKECEAST